MSKIGVVIGRKTQGCGFGKDFPARIDVKRVGQLKAGTRCNERIQVEHGSALLPHECMQSVDAIRRRTNDLSAGVQATAAAARVTGHSAEIVDFSMRPKDGIVGLIAGRASKLSRADNHSGFVQPDRFRVVAAESAQVLDHAVFPKERMAAGAARIEHGEVAGGWVCCQARHADDLMEMICALRKAIGAAQRTEVSHLSFVAVEGVSVREAGTGVYRCRGGRASDDQVLRLVAAASPRESIGSAQGSDIQFLPVLPDESVRREPKESNGVGVGIDGGKSYDLARIIDINSQTFRSGIEGSQVDDLTMLPEHSVKLRDPDDRINGGAL